jgi:hypothetical protein
VTFQGVRILFPNFSGLARRFNDEGDRNFNVILDEKTAQAMKEDGWNVKWLRPRDEREIGDPVLKVILKYERRDGTPTRPPHVVLITSRGKTDLTKDMLPILDWADIVGVDMIVNPYEYEPGSFTAYLKSGYFTIRENELELKYADVPDMPDSAQSIVLERPEEPPF